MGDRIFVFGSNLAGRHGKGAALYARQHYGAIYGQGEGRQGQSYGIATKDEYLRPLPISTIAEGIRKFIDYVRENPKDIFLLTPVGCGLAGFRRSDIRRFFEGAPENVIFLKEWDE